MLEDKMNIRTVCTLALATLLVGCPGDDPTPTTDPTDGPSRTEDVLALTGAPAAGADLFTSTSPSCAGCHGADGTGISGPNLNDVVPPLSDENLVDVLIDGVGSMPAYGSLSDQELADLTAYVLQEWGGSAN